MALVEDLRRLPREMQIAAAASVALGLSMLLPWYQKSFFGPRGTVVQENLSAFGVFTFVEAAVLLLAVAVLFLVWARSQRKAFHLPGGDGMAIILAGAWACVATGSASAAPRSDSRYVRFTKPPPMPDRLR